MRKLLFSVTKADLDIQTFRSGGKGGQHQNKTDSGVRIRHRASGAVGEARDSRSQARNKRSAFKRMVETPEFRCWHLNQCELHSEAGRRVAKLMAQGNLKVEVRVRDGWREID